MVGRLNATSIQGSVSEALEEDPGPLAEYEYVLISALDSVSTIAETLTANQLRSGDPSVEVLGADLLMSTNSLRDAQRREGLLHGFDEIWLFEQRPTVPRPASVTIMPPLDPTHEPLRSAIQKWMTRSRCEVGLADGMGLTIVTLSEDLIDELRTWGRR